MTDVGMDKSTLNVELNDPRKSRQATPVARAERMSVKSVSWMASSMNFVLSKLMSTLMSLGRVVRNSSSFCFTSWATVTALTPRCFLMPKARAAPFCTTPRC